MKRAPTSDIIWLFVVTRLLLVLITYIGFILFPVPPHVYPVSPVNITALLTSWNHWDAANFTRIAQYGYQSIYDTAFFPLFPFLYELWITRDSITTSDQNESHKILSMISRVLPLLIIPLGTLIYCFYCWKLFQNPLAFAAVQSHWDRHTTWPWVGILTALRELFLIQPFGSFYEVHLLLDLAATISFIALAILGWRKLRMSYNIWIVLLLFFMLITPATAQNDLSVSNQRFGLEMLL